LGELWRFPLVYYELLIHSSAVSEKIQVTASKEIISNEMDFGKLHFISKLQCHI